jgi:serine/threonine protein kinase
MVVDADSPYEKIKVMDFGLAKLSGTANRPIQKSNVTNTDFAVGTPGYISPEQVRGEELDHRSDLYSVGVIVFELLTGRLPFAGGETMDVLLAHATQPPPSFAEVGAQLSVPPAVEAVVQRCLAKNPADRHATARDLAESYEAALSVQEPAPTASQAAIPTEPLRRPNEDTPPPAAPQDYDPLVVVHHVEAFMPDQIATHKLRGFVDDVGGDVMESVPGKIRVRLGHKGSVYFVPGPLSWLGLGSGAGVIDMELQLERGARESNLIRITVKMRSGTSKASLSDSFKDRCGQVFCDLRAYLMGQGINVGE